MTLITKLNEFNEIINNIDFKEENVKVLDECPLCFNSLVHKVLNCECCNNNFCLDCLLKMPNREILFISKNYENNICNIEIDDKNEGIPQPLIKYTCPFCRTNNNKYFTEFKLNYDLIKIIFKDYTDYLLIKQQYFDIQKNNNNKYKKKYQELILNYEDNENEKNRFDNIAILKSKELKEEQIEHNNLKIKYNNLLLEINQIKTLFENLKLYYENIINNITTILQKKRNIKNLIKNYLKTLF